LKTPKRGNSPSVGEMTIFVFKTKCQINSCLFSASLLDRKWIGIFNAQKVK
jgi:hypothetical protein